MSDPRLEAIQEVVEPLLEGLGMELVELSRQLQGRSMVLKVFVDAVGGVTIQRCAKANRAVREALEEQGLLTENDAVEVASPGLDRPLKTTRDFERVLGERVDLSYCDDDGTEHSVKGVVLAVQDGQLILKLDADKLKLEIDAIKKATKALPW